MGVYRKTHHPVEITHHKSLMAHRKSAYLGRSPRMIFCSEASIALMKWRRSVVGAGWGGICKSYKTPDLPPLAANILFLCRRLYVDECCSSKHTIVDAKRIENSKMWSQYIRVSGCPYRLFQMSWSVERLAAITLSFTSVLPLSWWPRHANIMAAGGNVSR